MFKKDIVVSAPGGEFDFIRWVRERVATSPRLSLGIGDDTALLRFPRPADCLLTVDMLMEGVHFNLDETAPRLVGRKALAVNLSDIAAMAGRPLAAVVSVALPRQRGIEPARELHAGLQELADEFGVAVAGGGDNFSAGPLVVNIKVLGESTAKGAVRRSGARVGDWIFVTGALGGSLAGRHLSFQPRVDEALRLHETVDLHAMIDLSDGLSSDIAHLLEESGVGALLRAEAIPVSDEARAASGGKTPLERALCDGEDFELLFTVSADDGRRLLADPPIAVPLSHVGEIVAGNNCEIIDAAGTRRSLPPKGWVHPL